jgi:sugar lactone lactonase YvrE
MNRSSVLVSSAFVAALVACGGGTPPAASPAASTSPASAPGAKNSAAELQPAAPAPAAPPASAEPAKPAAPTPAVKWADVGFLKPESAAYDAEGDRYLVSNINGVGLAKDNNGFISVLSPEGTVTNLKWIEGGKNKVSLDGPKGNLIVKGTLYAADITSVRMFDLKTGAPKGDIPVTGATSLNDIAAGPDGKIYVSDTGRKIAADGKTLEPNGNDAIYVIEKGKAKVLVKGTEYGQPNGVLWTDKGLVAVTNDASGEVYRLDDKGKRQDVTKVGGGKLDGLLALGDTLLVTSWETNAIYRGKLGGTFEIAYPDQKSPADIGYDAKRNRLLVPLLMENTLLAYDLK